MHPQGEPFREYVPAVAVSQAQPRARLRTDLASFAILTLIALCALVFFSSPLPMQFADESRNANDALEMVRTNQWLVPLYGGQPDHWNTKPPLLIWSIALLMKLGVPALAALRLPPILATIAAAWMLWSAGRYWLQDALAGWIAALLLLGSYIWMGIHAARTGDYDTVESFFLTGYVLSFWRGIETDTQLRMGWLAVSGACIVLAVLTKGIAGALALPGLFLFAVTGGRCRALLQIRVLLLAAAVMAICLGYYWTRDLYDPGYLHAVWLNELGGRYLAVNEGHIESRLFYLKVLLTRFPLGMLLVPLAVLPLRSPPNGRRSFVEINLLCAAAVLLILMTARTQIKWYAVPLVPLISLASAVGATDGLARLGRRRCLVQAALCGVLVLGCVESWAISERAIRESTQPADGQTFYGQLLATARNTTGSSHLLVIDSGIPNGAGFAAYNPILRFYSMLAADHGLIVTQAVPGTAIAPGTWVGSCDPKSRSWLDATYRMDVPHTDRYCVLGRVNGPAGRSPALP